MSLADTKFFSKQTDRGTQEPPRGSVSEGLAATTERANQRVFLFQEEIAQTKKRFVLAIPPIFRVNPQGKHRPLMSSGSKPPIQAHTWHPLNLFKDKRKQSETLQRGPVDIHLLQLSLLPLNPSHK